MPFYNHKTSVGNDVEQNISYSDGNINWYNYLGKQLGTS